MRRHEGWQIDSFGKIWILLIWQKFEYLEILIMTLTCTYILFYLRQGKNCLNKTYAVGCVLRTFKKAKQSVNVNKIQNNQRSTQWILRKKTNLHWKGHFENVNFKGKG